MTKKTPVIVENDYITFTIIHIPTLIKKVKKKVKNEEGKAEIVIQEFEYKGKPLYLEHTSLVGAMSSIDPYINDRNQVVKSKCIVYDRFSGRDYLVNNSPAEMRINIVGKIKKIGF